MRRVPLGLLAVSAAVSIPAAFAAGCGSSSAAPAGGADASAEAALDDAGTIPNACYVDASLTAFAESDASAAGCAACVNASCSGAITKCATDCICINLFTCLTDSGVVMSGTGSAIAAAVTACSGSLGLTLLKNPGVQGLVNCLSGTCSTPCSAVLEGGVADAASPPDAAPDATDGGADGGLSADASDDG